MIKIKFVLKTFIIFLSYHNYHPNNFPPAIIIFSYKKFKLKKEQTPKRNQK